MFFRHGGSACGTTRLVALKRIIELGFRGGATEPKLNPSQARSGKHAENEREGTQVVK